MNYRNEFWEWMIWALVFGAVIAIGLWFGMVVP